MPEHDGHKVIYDPGNGLQTSRAKEDHRGLPRVWSRRPLSLKPTKTRIRRGMNMILKASPEPTSKLTNDVHPQRQSKRYIMDNAQDNEKLLQCALARKSYHNEWLMFLRGLNEFMTTQSFSS